MIHFVVIIQSSVRDESARKFPQEVFFPEERTIGSRTEPLSRIASNLPLRYNAVLDRKTGVVFYVDTSNEACLLAPPREATLAWAFEHSEPTTRLLGQNRDWEVGQKPSRSLDLAFGMIFSGDNLFGTQSGFSIFSIKIEILSKWHMDLYEFIALRCESIKTVTTSSVWRKR